MQRPPARSARKAPVPLDLATLEALALHYVGRYATTRAKLAAYLARKVRARGWAEDGEPPLAALAERLATLGYVDDRGFATARGAALGRRGFGPRRVNEALLAAGVSESDGADARQAAGDEALAAILALARRKRIGPFAPAPLDRDERRRAIAALVRAGHDFTLARRVVDTPAGEQIDDL